MSATVPFVFISACTRDLQHARIVLRDALFSLGCHPVLQDHFEVTPSEPIVDKLRRKIADCDYVIHLAGKCYGAAPGASRDGGERSYTQIEYHLAQELGKKTFAFICADDFPYQPEDGKKYPQPESDHQRDLQQSHRDMLRHRPGNPEYAHLKSLEQAAAILGQADLTFHELTDRVRAAQEEILNYLRDIKDLILAGEAPPVIWNEPRRAARLFGRGPESADVHRLLTGHGRVAILGSGGKGKTALAAEVLHQLGPPAGHPGPYARRLLLHDYYISPAHDAVLPGLLSQAGVDPRGLTTEQMTDALRSQLGQPGTHLYLEGCEKAAELHRLTALAGSAVILLTTRDGVAPEGFTGYRLPALSDAEGAALIASLADKAGDGVPLAHFLGGHALACSQAGHVLARRGQSAAWLLDGLRSEGLEKLGGEKREHASIAWLLEHTWELAAGAHAGCPDVWTALALGALAPLPESLLLSAAGHSASDLENCLDWLTRQGITRVEPIVSGPDGITEPHWSLEHPLMREHVMNESSPRRALTDSRYPAWRNAWIAFLEACFYGGIVPGGWQRYERLVPHFDALLEAITRRQAPEAFVHTRALTYVAVMHSRHGNLALAEGYYRKNTAWCEAHLGPDDRDTLSSLNNLAISLKNRGVLDEAEPLYRRALEAQERTLGPEHPDTLAGLTNLASLLRERGALDEAEPLCRRAMEALERTLGPEHPRTLGSLDLLANILSDRGMTDEAEPHYRRALEARERTLGPEHPDTLSSLNNLGALRESQGRLEEAEALYVRAVAGAQKLYLPEHPERQGYERNLARVREERGQAGG